MGLSFHYRGSLIHPEVFEEMMDEVEDIASILGWPLLWYNRNFPVTGYGSSEWDGLMYGLSFQPRDCEPVYLTFLSNGRLCNPVLCSNLSAEPDPEEEKYRYLISVKTQFAGVETHKKIMQLFRYLNIKYFASFRMMDEGNFWESSDEKALETNFQQYAELLESFSAAIAQQPTRVNETVESYLERLIRLIREKRSGKE